jgi:hypothetical protein
MSSSATAQVSATEVELTADDLQEMKPLLESVIATAASSQSEPMVSKGFAEQSATTASSAPSSLLYVALSAGVAIAAVTAFVLVSRHSAAPQQAVPTFVTTVPQRPDALVDTDEAPVVAGPPVRFANPFDRSEIFEFPPGTTRAEARDAVADILMQRAQERAALVKTHPAKGR